MEQMLTEVVAGRLKLWAADRCESVLATPLFVWCNKEILTSSQNFATSENRNMYREAEMFTPRGP